MAGSRLDFNTGRQYDPAEAAQGHLNAFSSIIGNISKQYLDKQQHAERMEEDKIARETADKRFAQEMAFNREKWEAANTLAQAEEARNRAEYDFKLSERDKALKTEENVRALFADGGSGIVQKLKQDIAKDQSAKAAAGLYDSVHKNIEDLYANGKLSKENYEAQRNALEADKANFLKRTAGWNETYQDTPLYENGKSIADTFQSVDPTLVRGAFMKELAGAGVDYKNVGALADELLKTSGAVKSGGLTPEQSINSATVLVRLGQALEGVDNNGKVGRGKPFDLPTYSPKEFDSSAFLPFDTDAADQVNKTTALLKADPTLSGLTDSQYRAAAAEAVKNTSNVNGDVYKLAKGFDPASIVADAKVNAVKLGSSGGRGISAEMPAEAKKAYEQANAVLEGLVKPTSYRQPDWEDGYAGAMAKSLVQAKDKKREDKQPTKPTEAIKEVLQTATPLNQNSLAISVADTDKVTPEAAKAYGEQLMGKGVSKEAVGFAIERAVADNNPAPLLALNPEYNIRRKDDWLGQLGSWLDRGSIKDEYYTVRNNVLAKALENNATIEQAKAIADADPDVAALAARMANASNTAADADAVRRMQALPAYNVRNLLKQVAKDKTIKEPDNYKSIMGWSINK